MCVPNGVPPEVTEVTEALVPPLLSLLAVRPPVRSACILTARRYGMQSKTAEVGQISPNSAVLGDFRSVQKP